MSIWAFIIWKSSASPGAKNNLDFHLAFHLGRLHREAKPHVVFHVISRDQGYDGLIEHMNGIHRSTQPVEPRIPLSPAANRMVGLLENKDGSVRIPPAASNGLPSPCPAPNPRLIFA